MKNKAVRTLRIADAMVLIVAFALGTVIFRASLPDFRSIQNVNWPRGRRTFLWIGYGITVSAPILAVWTPTVLVLRLIPPRPCLRRLARRPGMVACAAGTLGIGAEVV